MGEYRFGLHSGEVSEYLFGVHYGHLTAPLKRDPQAVIPIEAHLLALLAG